MKQIRNIFTLENIINNIKQKHNIVIKKISKGN